MFVSSKNALLSLGLIATLSVPAFAAASVYKVDASHSSVAFEVRHMVTPLRGEFKEYVGAFTYDAKTQTLGNVAATINVSSVDTRNEKRDGHLKSPDFFNVQNNPSITFKATKVTKKGKNYLVAGTFTMLGVSKPVTLQATVNGTGKNPWGQEVVGISASGQINRKDYGLNWNKALDNGGVLIGNDVKLVLEIEAVKQ